MTTINLGALADVADGSGRVYQLAGREPIAVFRIGEELFAIDDTCSHADASLCEGDLDVDEACIECPLHGSLFDLRTGKPKTLPAFAPVKTYRVWNEGEKLFVEFPD